MGQEAKATERKNAWTSPTKKDVWDMPAERRAFWNISDEEAEAIRQHYERVAEDERRYRQQVADIRDRYRGRKETAAEKAEHPALIALLVRDTPEGESRILYVERDVLAALVRALARS